MAHYAFLDENNVVTEVIPGRHEYEEVNGISDWEEYYGNLKGQVCLRTSFNGNIRRKFADIGDTYDAELDGFIPESPHVGWTFNTETWLWEPPFDPPNTNGHYWDDETGNWVALPE